MNYTKNGKYLTVFFVMLLLAMGCRQKPTGEAKVQTTDSTALFKPDSKAFYDNYLKADSVKMVVQHCDTNNGTIVDELIYIDYKWNNPDKKNALMHDDTLMQSIAANRFAAPDTSAGVVNANSNLFGTYCQVKKLRGQWVLGYMVEVEEDLNFTYTIADRVASHVNMEGDEFFGYRKVDKKNNAYVFLCGKPGNNLDIEIKQSPANDGLQVWKISYNTSGAQNEYSTYQFMLPLNKAVQLPVVYSVNDLGLGADMEIPFDTVRVDSVFAKW